MKTIYKYLFILLSIIFFYSCDKNTSEPNDCGLKMNIESNPVLYKVLFIGSSHTAVNDIPKTIKDIAINNGDSIQTHQESPGGSTLKRHSTRPETIAAIKSEEWDFVILQCAGWEQALPPYIADTAVYRYAETLIDLIKNNSLNTKVILYMTHGYKDGVLSFNDSDWCEQDPLVCDYSGMQVRIRDNYITLGNLLNVEVAPCGVMWKVVMDNNPEINLHASDKVHASPSGSYVSACTIYSHIFKKSPRNNFKHDNVDQDNAQKIHETVSDALFDCNPNWESYQLR